MSLASAVFIAFIATTLAITYWAAKRSHGASAYFAAGRRITAWQNGFAVAGDFMSAASFLGIVGLIALQGFDGFFYSIGGFVAFVTILLLVAEPLRNTGSTPWAIFSPTACGQSSPRHGHAQHPDHHYLLLDRANGRRRRAGHAAVRQFRHQLQHRSNRRRHANDGLCGLRRDAGHHLGSDHQSSTAIRLRSGLTVLVLAHFHFRILDFFAATSQVTFHHGAERITADFLQPGQRYHPPYGPLDLISLSLIFAFGTAGLPHILVKFYTVPDAQTARKSVVWAMVLIGGFYIMTSVLGLGAAVVLGPDYILTHGGTNMGGPLLARALGGNAFLAVVSAVAFATILAVVAGLMISASTSFAHDFWVNVVHKGAERRSGETVLVARIAALAIGTVSILIAIKLGPASNAGILATFGMAAAASANFPVIVLSIFWRRFNTAGAVGGLSLGLLSVIVLVAAGPNFMGIDQPGAAVQLGTRFSRRPGSRWRTSAS